MSTLEDKNMLYEKIINSTYDAILVTDQNGRIIVANDATLERMKLTREEVLGKVPGDLIENNIYLNSTVMEAIKNRKTITDIVNVRGKVYLSTSVPIFDDNNDLTMIITSNRSDEILDKFSQLLNYEQKQHARYHKVADYFADYKANNYVYQSPVMESVVNNCISIAETDSSVMIRGESGVGKEGIAKLIHSSSKRKDFPMIPVNCGAIPPELFESEFFGYRPGAFTGANAKGKTGFVQLAHKGTLFLDEVGELPLPMQSKLLRFVETGEYYPIGSAKAEKADVRIIAATSRDLSQMIKDKTFREDLYYRLHVLPIRIPPLRDRPEDIECIALYYLEKFNKKYKKNLVLRPSDIELLQQYSWPGNIRELRNSIERTVVLNNLDKARKVIEALINPYIQDAEPLKNSSNFSVQPDLPLNTALEQFELRYLQAVVDHHGGHLQDAANTLGIHRSTLYRKLHR